jgi:hypothetical protein
MSTPAYDGMTLDVAEADRREAEELHKREATALTPPYRAYANIP